LLFSASTQFTAANSCSRHRRNGWGVRCTWGVAKKSRASLFVIAGPSLRFRVVTGDHAGSEPPASGPTSRGQRSLRGRPGARPAGDAKESDTHAQSPLPDTELDRWRIGLSSDRPRPMPVIRTQLRAPARLRSGRGARRAAGAPGRRLGVIVTDCGGGTGTGTASDRRPVTWLRPGHGPTLPG
jgi:hypothetical protein